MCTAYRLIQSWLTTKRRRQPVLSRLPGENRKQYCRRKRKTSSRPADRTSGGPGFLRWLALVALLPSSRTTTLDSRSRPTVEPVCAPAFSPPAPAAVPSPTPVGSAPPAVDAAGPLPATREPAVSSLLSETASSLRRPPVSAAYPPAAASPLLSWRRSHRWQAAAEAVSSLDTFPSLSEGDSRVAGYRDPAIPLDLSALPVRTKGNADHGFPWDGQRCSGGLWNDTQFLLERRQSLEIVRLWRPFTQAFLARGATSAGQGCSRVWPEVEGAREATFWLASRFTVWTS